MRTNDKKALHTKELKELRTMASELRSELANARLEHSMYKLKNTRSLSTKRKELAQVLTIMKEKEKEQNGKNA